jgi:putative transcriptional regulator
MDMKREAEEQGGLSGTVFEAAVDAREADSMTAIVCFKTTMRQVGMERPNSARPLTPEDVRSIREEAGMSQAVFARHLNVTSGYVSRLERGVKRPTGAALALLNVIRRKGLDAIL